MKVYLAWVDTGAVRTVLHAFPSRELAESWIKRTRPYWAVLGIQSVSIETIQAKGDKQG